MTKVPYIYFHGGPGMNSLGEQALLGPILKELGRDFRFWSEPRSSDADFDPQRAFTGWMKSARNFLRRAVEQHAGPVHVLAHSFAAQGLCRIALEHPELFRSLTLIAPVLNVDVWCRNVLRIAAGDFEKVDPAKSQVIVESLGESRACFDAPMQSAFMVAAQDEALFTNYWSNAEMMSRFFGIWQKHGVGLDAGAFFSVLGELSKNTGFEAIDNAFRAPIHVVFGRNDRVSTADSEIEMCRGIFGEITVHFFEKSAHFPHLEEIDRFLEVTGLRAKQGDVEFLLEGKLPQPNEASPTFAQ